MGDRYVNVYYRVNDDQAHLDIYVTLGDEINPPVYGLMYSRHLPYQYSFQRVAMIIIHVLSELFPHVNKMATNNLVTIQIPMAIDVATDYPLFAYNVMEQEGNMLPQYLDYNIVLVVDHAITRCIHDFE
jgi:hypothetical protein